MTFTGRFFKNLAEQIKENKQIDSTEEYRGNNIYNQGYKKALKMDRMKYKVFL